MHFIRFDNETRCESAIYEYKNSLTIAEMIREMLSWSEKFFGLIQMKPRLGITAITFITETNSQSKNKGIPFQALSLGLESLSPFNNNHD